MRSLDKKLKGVRTVGISGHVRPDGDCVGSTLAVYNYIRDYYPDIRAEIHLEPIPDIFKFLKRSAEIRSDYPARDPYDLFICLDCGDAGRLGSAAPYFAQAKDTVCIDHHVSNRAFANDNYIEPDASSTCELVFALMDKEKISKEIAECLYTGIVHDTGVFQYSCTSAETMIVAGWLMERGIDYPKIVDDTFYTKTYSQNRILGLALLKSRLYLDGQVIVSAITAAEMEEFGVLPKHLDGIVNQLRVTRGVKAAVFLYETAPGVFKASTRANSDVNLAELAGVFGGGGHVKAAGFSIEGDLEDSIGRILKEMECRL